MFGIFGKTIKEYKKGYGLYYKEEYEDAIPHLKYAAENGHSDAQFLLGDCYDNARGTEENLDNAILWYQKAANQGHAEARYRIGMMYIDSMGMVGVALHNVEQSNDTSKLKINNDFFDGLIGTLGDTIKDLGDYDAMEEEYNRLYDEAKKWLGMAARQGHEKAQKEYKEIFEDD